MSVKAVFTVFTQKQVWLSWKEGKLRGMCDSNNSCHHHAHYS